MRLVAALVAMLTLGLFPTVAFGQQKPKKSSSQLKSQLSSIQRRKAVLKRELVKAKIASKQVRVDLQTLDNNLEILEGELDQTQHSLEDGRNEQVELGQQLGVAEKRVVVVKDQVRTRLKYIYMHEGQSVISAFVGASTIGDIASRKLVLEAIAKKDRSLFNEYRELQEKIADRKKRQDNVVTRIAGLKTRQLVQQTHLEVTKDDKKDALKSLQARQDQIQSLLAQLQADEADVYSEIRAYEAAKGRNAKPGSKPAPIWVGRFLKPANGPITSTFGYRMHPILHYRRLHAGIDIGAKYGSRIVAAGDGVVIAARYSRSFGNMVIIDHGNGLSTLYAHASKLFVHSGQVVKRGQAISAVGSTGLASGPHLHWEVRVNGTPVNPMGRF